MAEASDNGGSVTARGKCPLSLGVPLVNDPQAGQVGGRPPPTPTLEEASGQKGPLGAVARKPKPAWRSCCHQNSPLTLPLLLRLPAPRHINPFVPRGPVQAQGPRLKGQVKNCQSEGPKFLATSWVAHSMGLHSTHTWKLEEDSMEFAPPVHLSAPQFPHPKPGQFSARAPLEHSCQQWSIFMAEPNPRGGFVPSFSWTGKLGFRLEKQPAQSHPGSMKWDQEMEGSDSRQFHGAGCGGRMDGPGCRNGPGKGPPNAGLLPGSGLQPHLDLRLPRQPHPFHGF